MMIELKSSPVLPISVIPATDNDKLRLLTQLSAELDETKLALTRVHLDEPGTAIFLVVQAETDTPLGFILTADYPRMSQSKEIILYAPRSYDDVALYQAVLEEVINLLGEDPGTHYIILKIRDSLTALTNAALALGFMKDGLFISNQFLEGEFTYYSVYQYKLV